MYAQYKYLLDPHGAVGYKALEMYLEQFPERKGIVLETAHPVKFPDSIEEITGKPVEIPASVAGIMKLEKKSVEMDATSDALKSWLLNR